MKKIIYIIVSLVCISFSACNIESSERPIRTAQGQVAFAITQSFTDDYVRILDMAARVNYYESAPDSLKSGIKAYYLSGYAITEANNTYILEDSLSSWTFAYTNRSLNASGSVWSVSLKGKVNEQDEILVSDSSFVINCSAPRMWNIKVNKLSSVPGFYIDNRTNSNSLWVNYTNYRSYLASADLTVSADIIPPTMINQDTKSMYLYNIEKGTGYTDQIDNTLNTNATSAWIDLKWSLNKTVEYMTNLSIKQGEYKMTVTNPDSRIDNITAQIIPQLPPRDHTSDLTIIFNDLSETITYYSYW